MKNKNPTRAIIFIISMVLIALAFFNFNNNVTTRKIIDVDFSDFVAEIERGSVKSVTMSGGRILGQFNSGEVFKTITPPQYKDLVSNLLNHGVHIKASSMDDSFSLLNLILSWLPTLILIGIWIFSIKQIGKGSNRVTSFGRFNARKKEATTTTFDDVAGADEAKEDLLEIIDFLKNPDKFQKLGARIPKGVLLVGPPGTGKTLLARAVAGESNCAFFSASGSEFIEMFVGVGASRVRDLFDKAKQTLPCIIFIDEIDAMGRHRSMAGGSNEEREQTLNEFLVQLDGFSQNKGLMVFAATNRPDILDPALVRSGRFDRMIRVDLPDINQREKILEVHAKKIILNPTVVLRDVAKATPGFSGADLENLLNEGALQAARYSKDSVTKEDIEFAKDKIMMGSERKNNAMRPEEKRVTAFHEAGHAIMAYFSKNSDPIHKVTIIPRGRALGMVVQLPEFDKVSVSRIYLIEKIRILMSGRIAEFLMFGVDYITAGASNDIEVATNIAKRMVLEFGMSDVCGMLNYMPNENVTGIPNSSNSFSPELQTAIDSEIKKIIDDAYSFSLDFLNNRLDLLHKLGGILLEKETLNLEEVKMILEVDADVSQADSDKDQSAQDPSYKDKSEDPATPPQPI